MGEAKKCNLNSPAEPFDTAVRQRRSARWVVDSRYTKKRLTASTLLQARWAHRPQDEGVEVRRSDEERAEGPKEAAKRGESPSNFVRDTRNETAHARTVYSESWVYSCPGLVGERGRSLLRLLPHFDSLSTTVRAPYYIVRLVPSSNPRALLPVCSFDD